MRKGRRRELWMETSSLMALIVNMMAKKGDPVRKFWEFHPDAAEFQQEYIEHLERERVVGLTSDKLDRLVNAWTKK